MGVAVCRWSRPVGHLRRAHPISLQRGLRIKPCLAALLHQLALWWPVARRRRLHMDFVAPARRQLFDVNNACCSGTSGTAAAAAAAATAASQCLLQVWKALPIFSRVKWVWRVSWRPLLHRPRKSAAATCVVELVRSQQRSDGLTTMGAICRYMEGYMSSGGTGWW